MPKYSDEKKQLVEALIKDKIFHEACKLLKRDRPDLFSMRELADHVEVSKGTLYNYFKDKYEVIFFIESRLKAEGEKNISELLSADEDYRAILCNLIKHLYLGYKKYRFIFAAASIARAEKCKRGEPVQLNDGLRNIVWDFFHRGVERGELIEETPAVLDQYMMVVLGGLNLYPYADLKNTALPENLSDELVDKIIAHAVNGICRKDT